MKFVLAVFTASAFISCTAQKENQTLTLYSKANLDGAIYWHAGDLHTNISTGAAVNLGDDGSDADYTRIVASFDMSSLPAGAQIQSASLRMYQNDQSAGTSYLEAPDGLGDVRVDRVSYSTFSANSNFTTTTKVFFGTLATSYSANTWRELDITEQAMDEFTAALTGRLTRRPACNYSTASIS